VSARAVRRLFEIPLKISPLAGPFVAGIIAFLEAGVLWFGFATRATGGLPSTSNVFVLKIGLLLVGILGSMFLSLLGQGLRSIARPETRLLPHLGRNLAAAGSLWFTFLWLVPLVLAGIFGLFSPTLLVAVGGLTALLFVWALFVNAWPFPRGMLPVVLAFFGLPLLPPPFRRVLLAAALSAPVGAAALVLAGALLVKLARHLFAPADTPEALAPLSAIGMGSLRANPRRATAQSARPSRLRSRVEAWVTAPVGARLEKRLALLRARPDHRHRVRAVRLLLMPAENPRGWLVRLVTLAFFLGLYALAFLSGGPRPGSFHTLLFGYIVLAGFSSMSVIPFARERTRRHLAELYLTLGLETPQDFRAVVADAYLGILTGVVVVTLSLLVLAAVLLSPTRILTIFLTGLVVLPPLALFLLAAVLHMPERTLPRVLLGIPLFGLTFLALPIALVVMRDLGVTTGALVTGVTGAIVAAGTWRASRRLWIESPLDFGAPDPRLPL
jgi:hypothetical protein